MKKYLLIILIIVVILTISIYVYYIHYTPTQREESFPYDPRIAEVVMGLKPSIVVKSVFSNGEDIPRNYTCDGRDTSPPIEIADVPKEAQSLVIIMFDPDAPRGTFFHWILVNIPPNAVHIPQDLPKNPVTDLGIQLKNDFGFYGYGGPCPPPGSRHRYVIVVMALDTKLSVDSSASLDQLIEAVKGHTISYGYIYGYYAR